MNTNTCQHHSKKNYLSQLDTHIQKCYYTRKNRYTLGIRYINMETNLLNEIILFCKILLRFSKDFRKIYKSENTCDN